MFYCTIYLHIINAVQVVPVLCSCPYMNERLVSADGCNERLNVFLLGKFADKCDIAEEGVS